MLCDEVGMAPEPSDRVYDSCENIAEAELRWTHAKAHSYVKQMMITPTKLFKRQYSSTFTAWKGMTTQCRLIWLGVMGELLHFYNDDNALYYF
jgi:hypothetical protein